MASGFAVGWSVVTGFAAEGTGRETDGAVDEADGLTTGLAAVLGAVDSVGLTVLGSVTGISAGLAGGFSSPRAVSTKASSIGKAE